MKPPTLLLAAAWAALLFTGCDNSDSSAETEELKRRLDQLEQEKRESAEKARVATEEELAKAREQLALALDALNKAEPAPKAEVEVKGAGKAVVVAEDPEPQPAEGEDYRVFFKELSAHGEWFETTDYGYMWQPREARENRAWRPYTRGRWLDSDQGWTWASDEPFGWATFHHGRWALLEKHGWAWVPGDQWAPAWVSWRQSEDYVGWAPLPPETLYHADQHYDSRVDTTYDLAPSSYSFVPVGKFNGPVAAHCVPNEAVMEIVVHSENVTRIETRKQGVYSGGPERDWLARRAGAQPVRWEVQRHRERLAGAAQQRVRGNRLDVFAPPVAAPWNSAVRPQRVSGNWGEVSVVRGGGAMDPGALERYRGELMARHEAARRAMQRDEVRRALLRERQAREEAARQAATRCQPSVHEALEEALRVADLAYEAASERLVQRGLNPKQRAYAELALKKAEQDFRRAEAAYADHMVEFHSEEWARTEAQRIRAEAQRQARQEQRRQLVCQPSEHERLEEAYLAARREVEVTRQAIEEGQLNPKQVAYAEMRLKNGRKALEAAERPYLDHMLKHHPEEYRAQIAAQARVSAERELLEERRRVEALAKEDGRRAAEDVRRLAEARAEAARQAEMEAKARAEAEVQARARAEAEARLQAAREAEVRAETERRAEEERRRQRVCDPSEHEQLETAYGAARNEWTAAQQRLTAGGLNPKQLAYARLAAGNAQKKLDGAEQAYLAHLQTHHPQDYRQLLTERTRDAERRAAEAQAREAERLAEDTRRREEAVAEAAAEKARMAAEREAAGRARAEAEKARADAQRLAAEKAQAEAIRAAAAKQQALERLAAERAAAVAKAEAEAEAKAEARAALLAERTAREAALRQKPKQPATPVGCDPANHQQIEENLKAAKAAAEDLQKKLEEGRLNPRQAAYARRAQGLAVKQLNSAQGVWEAHMAEHHAEQWQEILAERAAAAEKAKKEAEEARKGKKLKK